MCNAINENCMPTHNTYILQLNNTLTILKISIYRLEEGGGLPQTTEFVCKSLKSDKYCTLSIFAVS